MTAAELRANRLRVFIMGIIWGATFLFIAVAVNRGVPPFTISAARLTVGTLALAPLALRAGGFPRDGRFWLFSLLAAIFSNALPFTLIGWAQKVVSPGTVAIYMATLPLLTLSLSHFLVAGERLTPRKALGVAVGFAGVLVLLGPAALGGLMEADALPQLACLGSAVCYALGSISMKRAPRAHPLVFAAAATGLGALLALTGAFVFEAPFETPWTPASIGAVVVLGLFPTALATVLTMQVLDKAGPPFLSSVNYQIPLWGTFFSAVVLREWPEPRTALALALILGGLYIGQSRAGALRAQEAAS